MVERRVCTFCGEEIEPGTGRMYIKKDGVVYNFCTSKCFKNLVILGRVPRRTTWTQYYAREKQIRMKGVPPPAAEAPKARRVKKTEKPEEKLEQKKEEAKEAPKEEKPKTEEKKPSPKEPAKKAAAKKPEPAKKSEDAKAEKPKPKPQHKDKPEESAKA